MGSRPHIDDGAAVEQQLHNVRVSFQRGLVDGCVAGIVAVIDVGANVNQFFGFVVFTFVAHPLQFQTAVGVTSCFGVFS